MKNIKPLTLIALMCCAQSVLAAMPKQLDELQGLFKKVDITTRLQRPYMDEDTTPAVVKDFPKNITKINLLLKDIQKFIERTDTTSLNALEQLVNNYEVMYSTLTNKQFTDGVKQTWVKFGKATFIDHAFATIEPALETIPAAIQSLDKTLDAKFSVITTKKGQKFQVYDPNVTIRASMHTYGRK